MPTLAGTTLHPRARTTTGGISPRPLRARGHVLRGGIPRDQTISAATAIRAPIAYGPRITQPGTVTPELVAKLFRRNNLVTPVATFDQSFAKTFQDELNEPGFGSITLENSDPDLALWQDGDLIRFEVKGAAAWTMLPSEIMRVTIAGNEEVGEVTTISGPGHLAVLAEALVYPARGVGVLPIEEDRVFNFAAVDYDDSGWGNALALTSWMNSSAYWYGLTGWPDPDAMWIWAQNSGLSYAPLGRCYFRKTFTVPDDVTRIIVMVAADDQAELYLDGQRLISTSPWTNSQNDIYTHDLDVSPGQHVVAIAAENLGIESGFDNPAGVLCSIYATNEVHGIGDTPIVATDATWKIAPYPADPPGMTPGEVLRHVVEEAQARGALAGVTLNFTDETDSDGVAWQQVADIATKVGTDCLTLAREMSGTYIDVWMEPAGLRLWAWVKDGRGEARDVSVHGPTDPDDPNSGNIGERGLTHRKVI